jgi:NAD(P)-dependent dehydrogenase (short-subunit alcohol dehydrogenase family)
MNFNQTMAVVTGGASGLGRAAAERVLAAGGKAVILDVQEAAGRAAAQEMGATFVKCDVSVESQVTAAMAEARRAMNGLNLLVNCAGVIGVGKMLGKEGPMAGEYFEKVIRINLVGTFLCDKAAAALMRDNAPTADGERGVLIHTASVAAFEGQIGQVAYAATKAGIARELAQLGIRCVAIAPGIFMTPMLASLSKEVQDSLGKQIPFPSRLGKPEEFAQLVQSIVEIPTLNGEIIRLDGAIRMQPR